MSQDTDPPHGRPRGRPPSAEARARILRAAHDILMAEGLARLTVEAVAARSGTGKPTIYRHFANAHDLAMAALVARPAPPADASADAPAEGPLGPALTALLANLVAAFATPRGRQVALMLATADPDSEFTRAFRNRVILTSREAGRRLIAAAAARGEIAEPPGVEVLLDMIFGPVFYRLLVGHQPLSADLAPRIVDLALAALPPLPAPDAAC
ncbi:MAG: TetR/AcrR family transcriptional regulator [Paracoccaceae bacterium]|nr:MAG: TetR/AcrR family transcriptional regulator [Paracoccaceae bacterium]